MDFSFADHGFLAGIFETTDQINHKESKIGKS